MMKPVGLTFYDTIPMLTPLATAVCKRRYDDFCEAYSFVKSEKIEFGFTDWVLDLREIISNTYRFETNHGEVWYVSNTYKSRQFIDEIVKKYGLEDYMAFCHGGFWNINTIAILWDDRVISALSKFGVSLK